MRVTNFSLTTTYHQLNICNELHYITPPLYCNIDRKLIDAYAMQADVYACWYDNQDTNVVSAKLTSIMLRFIGQNITTFFFLF